MILFFFFRVPPGEDAASIPLKRKFLPEKQTDNIAIYTVIHCLALMKPFHVENNLLCEIQ